MAEFSASLTHCLSFELNMAESVSARWLTKECCVFDRVEAWCWDVCVHDSLLEACQSHRMLNGVQNLKCERADIKRSPKLHAKWDPDWHLDAAKPVGSRWKVKSRRDVKSALTVLTVTLKGVAAVEDGSMVAEDLSAEPGMLRRRPVLSGGDSAHRRKEL